MSAGVGVIALGVEANASHSFSWNFPSIVGVFISTYKNWTYRGSWPRQYAKLSLLSMFFAYPMVMAIQGSAAIGLVATHVHVLSNMVLNNAGKTIWAQIPRMGDRHRQFTKPLPGGVKRSGVMNQSFYMINWTLRLADLIQVPGGKIIFIGAMPLGLLLSYWYAKSHGFPEAEEMRQALRKCLRDIKNWLQNIIFLLFGIWEVGIRKD